MDRKIRVGAVSYLNTKPLLYGIRRAEISREIDLTIDYPSRIARMLLADQIDIGLVPVAIIPQMDEFYINGDYCIGSNGPVASVCLFSEVPLEKVERVLLDYQSRTSVQLAKMLLKEHWKVEPVLMDAGMDFRRQIDGTTAGVVIGDRALEQRQRSSYIYDLGEAWKAHTGLPFVFAAWISSRPLDPAFISEFNEANKMGLGHIDEIVKENPYSLFSLHDYFTRFLDYRLDDPKRRGLERFLQYIQPGRPVPGPTLSRGS
ncbi:MAG: menaquinone biosynthesis protein [Bacteroidota bacterium]|nr:menaquinone biosynthesis protein [Bacteroidota bacterium]MDP4245005.1 menaquinone biosynthesis protein [Bacteroidota bacterium]MDP4252889.1 menaquinone biosynthesis protein [Bacteroidota bacterium]MDP4259122.1 menaquinone biosynthesis protein [Bacteroidota bacterium]